MGLAPLAIAGLAASALGTGASMYGSSVAKDKMNQDVTNEIMQQEALQKKATPIVNQNISSSSAPKAKTDIANNAASTLAKYNTIQALPSGNSPASTPVSTLTETQNKAKVGQQNDAASRLMGYSGWQNNQSINNQEANNQLGLIGSEAKSDAALLPLQLQQDQNAGGGWQTAGSLLSALGGLAGVAGAVGPASTAATTASGVGTAAPAVDSTWASAFPDLFGAGGRFADPMAGAGTLFQNPNLYRLQPTIQQPLM